MKLFSVLFTVEGRIDSLDAYNWYEQNSPELGKSFQECLDAKTKIFKTKSVNWIIYL